MTGPADRGSRTEADAAAWEARWSTDPWDPLEDRPDAVDLYYDERDRA